MPVNASRPYVATAFLAVLVAVMATAVLVSKAQAAFPGRNGALLVRGTMKPGCAQPTARAPSALPRCTLGDGAIRQDSLFLADRGFRSVRLFLEGVPAENTVVPSGRFASNGLSLIVGGGDFFTSKSLKGLLAFSSEPGLSPNQLAPEGTNPTSSPDMRSLAYNGPGGITTLTSGRQRLIRPLDAANPVWSSRNVIAFSDDPARGVCPHICLMRPDGTGVRPARLVGSSPDWSPNGHRLVVVSGDQRTAQIIIGCVNGTGIRRLTTRVPQGSLADPVWSPNGEKIAFDYQGDVYEIPTNTSRPLAPKSWHKVVANATLSDWQPLPGGLPARPAVVCH